MTTTPKEGRVATGASRGRQRIARAGLTGLTTLLARGMTLVVGLVTLPLASAHLGAERYGLWLTLGSFIAWIGILDLGMSNSLINLLAPFGAGERDEEDRRPLVAVSSAFWLSCLVAVLFLVIVLVVRPLIDWGGIFGVSSHATAIELERSIMLVALCLAIRLTTATVGAVHQGVQEGYYYQIWSSLAGVVAALALVAVIRGGFGLPVLAGVSLGGFILGDLLAGIDLFVRRRPWLRPSLNAFSRREAARLLRQGGQFWLAQISSVLMFQVGLLITSRLFGATEVGGYGTMLRIFAIVGSVQIAFIAPLWAAYGEAIAGNDGGWVETTFRRSVRVSLVWSVPASCVILVAMPLLLPLLMRSGSASPQYGWWLAIALAVTEIVNSAARCVSTLLNGLGVIRLQAICGPLAGLTNLGLSLLLGKAMGPAGVAWATAISLAVFWLAIMGGEASRRLALLSGRADS